MAINFNNKLRIKHINSLNNDSTRQWLRAFNTTFSHSFKLLEWLNSNNKYKVKLSTTIASFYNQYTALSFKSEPYKTKNINTIKYKDILSAEISDTLISLISNDNITFNIPLNILYRFEYFKNILKTEDKINVDMNEEQLEFLINYLYADYYHNTDYLSIHIVKEKSTQLKKPLEDMKDFENNVTVWENELLNRDLIFLLDLL